jgi:hypothetical protein
LDQTVLAVVAVPVVAAVDMAVVVAAAIDCYSLAVALEPVVGALVGFALPLGLYH